MTTLLALLMIGVRASEIRSYPLDERSVYTIRLSRKEPTTCVFPAAIKAIVGANVSTRTEDDPGILLSHEANTDYFSLRLLKDGAAGALNIILRGKVYALAFVSAEEPDRAVVFLDDHGQTTAGRSERTLRALIERAKQLDRDLSPVPGMASRVERVRPAQVVHYRSFNATIESITRFEAEDALVFHIKLENPREQAIAYDSAGLAIRLGREFFPALCVEASGAIPPQGSAGIYLLIAGPPEGGRANLPVRGNYSVILPHS